MSSALSQPMTLEAFLAWEERQELPWEFDGLAPVAMTGGTYAHAAIQVNLITALSTRLRGTPCQVVGSHLKLLVDRSVRYPDAMVVCRAVDAREQIIEDPVLVFEILSPSTALTDRIIKSREYFNTSSIRRYVMLEQDSIAATILERGERAWISTVATDGESLMMPEIGIEVPLAELYDRIVFEGTQPA